jgi:hypothetical protein
VSRRLAASPEHVCERRATRSGAPAWGEAPRDSLARRGAARAAPENKEGFARPQRAKPVLAGAVTLLVIVACSQGEGNGKISGSLNVPNCWTGTYELDPSFIAGIPYRESFQIRLQNDSDFESYTDGVSILIYDITQIRPDPQSGAPGKYGQPLKVSLQPSVTPPGVPIKPDPNPALVSMTVYLQKSCETQNVTLHAVEEVSIPADGTCDAPEVQGGDPTTGCDPGKSSPAGVGAGKSLISFTHVFDGNIDETTAAERLTAGCFDVYLADPREVAPGGLGPPPRCRGHIKGTFSFFFQRGRPAQPFP